MKKIYITFLALCSFTLFFAGTIDLDFLFNYSNQPIPAYINEDNTPASNPITDEGATLGRVLFYDLNLSATNSVSCASCHKQAFAFGDSSIQSLGHDGGLTGRHSPRLVNARFGEDPRFFWDERANTLEEQTTMPIQDHIEMGFSGLNGDPDLDSLISKLNDLHYYEVLFDLAFGDPTITEERMQAAMAQFVRSMQSFDSKYDVGRAQVGNNNADFPNFTTAENNGKALYMSNNATGCNRCHRAPEFDIDPDSDNNGVVGVAGMPGSIDIENVRSPSLRDIVNAAGVENGPYMHDGSLATLSDVIDHYDNIPANPNNTNLDNNLQGNNGNLNLTATEKSELLAFLKTLGGTNIYTDEKWSDPFDEGGGLELISAFLPIELNYFMAFNKVDAVNLEWETMSETNNKGFMILHSLNSIDWNELGFVAGENEPSTYKFTHDNPSNGINYYRLKQIDFDENFLLSKIRSATIEVVEVVDSYPNPTYDFINIRSSGSFNSANIYDVNGKLLRKVFVSNESPNIDLSDLVPGIYFIRLSNGNINFEEVIRVVKLGR